MWLEMKIFKKKKWVQFENSGKKLSTNFPNSKI